MPSLTWCIQDERRSFHPQGAWISKATTASPQPHDIFKHPIFSSWSPLTTKFHTTMSFGFSAGDCISVGQLTWAVYKACKGALGEFHELSRELRSLHSILHEPEDEAKIPISFLNQRRADQQPEL